MANDKKVEPFVPTQTPQEYHEAGSAKKFVKENGGNWIEEDGKGNHALPKSAYKKKRGK